MDEAVEEKVEVEADVRSDWEVIAMEDFFSDI